MGGERASIRVWRRLTTTVRMDRQSPAAPRVRLALPAPGVSLANRLARWHRDNSALQVRLQTPSTVFRAPLGRGVLEKMRQHFLAHAKQAAIVRWHRSTRMARCVRRGTSAKVARATTRHATLILAFSVARATAGQPLAKFVQWVSFAWEACQTRPHARRHLVHFVLRGLQTQKGSYVRWGGGVLVGQKTKGLAHANRALCVPLVLPRKLAFRVRQAMAATEGRMTRLHAWLELGLLVLRAAKLTMVTHVGLANTVQVLPRRRRPVNALQGTSAPTRPHPPTAASAILAISAQAALLIRSHALCFQATIVPVDPLLGPECRAPLADGVEATRHWPCPAIASLVRSVPRAPLSRLVCHVRKVSLVLGPTWTRCHAHARWDSTATLAVPMRLGLVSHVCKVSCRCRLCLAVSGIHVLSRCYNTRMHVADKYACHISAECPPGRFCRGGSHMRELCTCPPGIRVRAPPDNASCTHTHSHTLHLYLFNLRTCTGNHCPAGWNGTTDGDPLDGVECEAGVFCAGGHAVPKPCTAAPGFYCARGSPSGAGAPCPVGHWCAGRTALPEPCTALPGFFCPAQHDDTHGIPCPQGSVCRGGSQGLIPCDAEPGYSCPEGTSEAVICPVGMFCTGMAAPRLPCQSPKGNFCPEGTDHMAGEPCPLGFFCAGGVTDKAECQAEPGKFCPVGGGLAQGSPCPVGFYCEGGSSAPIECADTEPGRYCKQGSSEMSGSLCPQGFFCEGGPTDKAPCLSEPGFFCPEGSDSINGTICPQGHACGEGGSADALPCQCPPGKHCAEGSTELFGSTCPAGSFCVGGTKANESCTCNPGYFCPEGWSDPAGFKCPGGTWCLNFEHACQHNVHVQRRAREESLGMLTHCVTCRILLPWRRRCEGAMHCATRALLRRRLLRSRRQRRLLSRLVLRGIPLYAATVPCTTRLLLPGAIL